MWPLPNVSIGDCMILGSGFRVAIRRWCGSAVGETMASVQRPRMRISGPTFDSADPIALAEFYERLLGWPIVRREDPQPGNPSTGGWAMLRSPAGDQKIEVQWEPHHRAPTWPGSAGEPTMMLHLDIGVLDLSHGVEWALEQGARLADHQPQEDVRVMIDPDGHPFCLFPDQTV